MNKGLMLVISGPSGVGKGTVIAEVLSRTQKELGRNSCLSVSMTTRAPRPGEIDGIHYYFVTEETFLNTVKENGLAEYNYYAGHYYGTPIEPIARHLENGDIVLFDIDVHGAENIRRIFPDSVSVFITPPSPEELRRRIIGRGTNTPEEIERRLNIGLEELTRAGEFDYQVCNDEVERAAEELIRILSLHLSPIE